MEELEQEKLKELAIVIDKEDFMANFDLSSADYDLLDNKLGIKA